MIDDVYRQRARKRIADIIRREGDADGLRLTPEYEDVVTREEQDKEIARTVFDGRCSLT
jgi:hypothetical protein